MLPDEVKYGQTSLAGRAAQASAQLLQKDGGALGRTQEQDGVDLGDSSRPSLKRSTAKTALTLRSLRSRRAAARVSASVLASTATARTPASLQTRAM